MEANLEGEIVPVKDKQQSDDVHVSRVCRRLGVIPGKTTQKK